jgi:deoxycytidylate deaminase
MDSVACPLKKIESLTTARNAQSDLLVLGIVGAVGAGTSWTARVLKRLLERRGVRAEIVKARDGIQKAVGRAWKEALALRAQDPVRAAEKLQELGDSLRERHDDSIVATAMIAEIVGHLDSSAPPSVLICDSLRHPAEAKLLRMVYGDAYWTLGTVCDHVTRHKRLVKKFARSPASPPSDEDVQRFIDRDEDDAANPHGQHVATAFELADYFVDTSAQLSSPEAPDTELDAWAVTPELGRFLDLVRADRAMLRPSDAEQAMYHAYAARLGSACLSRQVGAALIDRNGQLLATGCNEVPRAGGGLYGQGEGDDEERERGRCHVLNGYCSNTRERNEIVDGILKLFEEHGFEKKEGDARERLVKQLRKSRIGQLIEFSRSVHAEMDALVSAARKGVSTVGAKLFVTTFPCHNCARHIVAAGVDEVQFIEPYLKSRALTLHADSITQSVAGWVPPSIARSRGMTGPYVVLFRPYVGAAPRLYRRAFVKDGEVKDPSTGDFKPKPEPGFLRHRPLGSGFGELQKRVAGEFKSMIQSASKSGA